MDWQKVKKDLLLAFSSHFFYKIVGYLVLVLLTRYLAKDKMGEFFFAAALATFFILLTELGTNSYLIREITGSPEKALRYFSEVFSLRLPFFAAYFLILNGFALIFKPGLLMVIFLTSVYVFFDEFYQIFGTLFLGLKRVTYNVIAGVSTRLLLVGCILIVVRSNRSLNAVLVCYILVNLILVVIAFALMRQKIGMPRPIWNLDSTRRILRISFPFFILSVLGLIHFKIDTLMLGFMKSYSVVATYESAYKLLEASQFVIRPMVMIFFPLCSEMAARQSWQETQTLLKKMLLVAGIAGSIIALLVLITADFIIPLLFGSKYHDSISVLRILYLSVPMLYMATVSTLLAKSIYLEKRVIKIMLTCVIVNIALNAISIPHWGALGSALATVITETILVIWSVRLNLQELRTLCSRESVSILNKGLDHVG